MVSVSTEVLREVARTGVVVQTVFMLVIVTVTVFVL